MPSIDIKEVDVSTASLADVTTNAVYVPGYSIQGPVKEPTLCETLRDFQEIFGSTPFLFTNTGTIDTVDTDKKLGFTYTWAAGKAEPSYVYACDLLRLGLPVLFERMDPAEGYRASSNISGTQLIPSSTEYVEGTGYTLEGVDSISLVANVAYTLPTGVSLEIDGVEYLTGSVVQAGSNVSLSSGESQTLGAALSVNTSVTTYAAGKVDAHTPGKASADTHFSLLPAPQTVATESGTTTYAGYKLTVWRDANPDLGTKEIPKTDTFFTFDESMAAQFSAYKKYDYNTPYTDSSELVDIEFPVATDNTVLTLENVADRQLQLSSTTDPEYTPERLYTYLYDTKLTHLTDKNEYVFKFITAGAYPVFGTDNGVTAPPIARILMDVATTRRDITALIDYNIQLDISRNAKTLRANVETWVKSLPRVGDGEDAGNYGAVFTPWGAYNSATINGQITLPPSFAYLSALAQSTQTFANWFAAAGITRGYIPNLVSTSYNISDITGNDIQPKNAVAINPIQYVKPYGYRVWGTRTLRNNANSNKLTATSFLNIRQLANDIKRVVYLASKQCMFEPDDTILFVNYKSMITPLLDKMKGNRGLTDYTIKRVATTAKATLKVVITLYCIDPVEDFDVTLELSDGQINIAE